MVLLSIASHKITMFDLLYAVLVGNDDKIILFAAVLRHADFSDGVDCVFVTLDKSKGC